MKNTLIIVFDTVITVFIMNNITVNVVIYKQTCEFHYKIQCIMTRSKTVQNKQGNYSIKHNVINT